MEEFEESRKNDLKKNEFEYTFMFRSDLAKLDEKHILTFQEHISHLTPSRAKDQELRSPVKRHGSSFEKESSVDSY